jgi:hypothetical protein
MPRLATVGSVEIRIYFRDTDRHKTPHFHAVGPDEEVLVSLPECRVLAGSMRSADYRRVVQWASENMARLVAEWDRCNPHLPVRAERAP